MRWIVVALIWSLLCWVPSHAQGTLLERRESLYNNIYVYERGDYVVMQFGKNQRFWTESVYDRRDPKVLPVVYTQYLTLALVYASKLDSVLEIGLGGGRTVAYLNLHIPTLSITSVELDPDVIDLAKIYFDVVPSESLQLVERDGRIHLLRDPNQHDVILVDAYRGPFVPFHMLTREFYQTAQRRLAEGGVLAQNIEPTTMLFDAAIATMSTVFDHVELYPAQGNVVAIAYDGPRRAASTLSARADSLQREHDFRYPLPDLLQDRRFLTGTIDAEPLTDDFAPVEMLKSIQRHNLGIDGISTPAGNEQ